MRSMTGEVKLVYGRKRMGYVILMIHNVEYFGERRSLRTEATTALDLVGRRMQPGQPEPRALSASRPLIPVYVVFIKAAFPLERNSPGDSVSQQENTML